LRRSHQRSASAAHSALASAERTRQIARMTRPEADTLAKVEVLADLEEVVHS
jgi:hypothetical protein